MTLSAASQRARYDELEHAIRWKRCARCGHRPSVAWLGVEYRIRCDCYPDPPTLMTQPNKDDERMGDMVNRAVARNPQSAAFVLTPEHITKYINPKATPQEVGLFLLMCQTERLNPLAGDAYLVSYRIGQSEPPVYKAHIILGVNAIAKRASANPTYAGMRSGVLVARGDRIIDREGTLMLDGDTLVGGWCEVYGKGWQVPYRHTVTLKDWDRSLQGQRGTPWDDKKHLMIKKVAESQALRRAMPGVIPENFGEREHSIPVSTEGESPALIPAQAGPTVIDGESAPVEGMAGSVAAATAAKEGFCPEHGAAFEQRSSPRGGKFWACPAKQADGSWCKKKPTDYMTAQLEQIAPSLVESGKTAMRVAEYLGRPWRDLETEGMGAVIEAVRARLAQSGPVAAPGGARAFTDRRAFLAAAATELTLDERQVSEIIGQLEGWTVNDLGEAWAKLVATIES